MTRPTFAPPPEQSADPATPASGHGAHVGFANLDERILAVEQRLIAREEGLRRRLHAVTQRIERATRPRRLAVPLLGAAAAGVALWWVARRLRPAGGHRHGDGRPAHSAAFQVPWVRLLGLAWPMLPKSWRARVDPSTASLMMSVGLPWVEHLWQSLRAAPRPAEPAASETAGGERGA